jgi:hypothetical protein
MARTRDELCYVDEKFTDAVRQLAISSGPMKERLEAAFLAIHTVRANDFDDPQMRAAYQSILERLTINGTVVATTAQMDANEGEDVANGIFELFLAIRRKLGEGEE